MCYVLHKKLKILVIRSKDGSLIQSVTLLRLIPKFQDMDLIQRVTHIDLLEIQLLRVLIHQQQVLSFWSLFTPSL